VRIAALDNLERIGDTSTYFEVEKLLKDPIASVRSTAVDTAARTGGKRSVPVLVNALQDTSWEVRRAAAKALGSLGEKSAVPGLCELVTDPDHDVRETVVAALGQLGDQRALTSVITALLDVERTVRNLAQAVVRKLDKDWENSAEARKSLPVIQSALSHPDYWVRYNARLLLEQLKFDVSSLIQQFQADDAETTEAVPPHAALPFLADLLFDRDRDLQLAAVEALGRLRERNAATVLATAARANDPAVQQAAHAALAALN
jgi:HEAT repeat protein